MYESNPKVVNKIVSDEYKYLYHYTTATGLLGILDSQSIRATHYSYLNDNKEITGFFDGRLQRLIGEEVNAGVIQSFNLNEERRKRIKAHGGIEVVTKQIIEELKESLSTALFKINEPYLASFCGSPSDHIAQNGLLSQWRGYGTDGGYALEFDSKSIEEMLHIEHESFYYGHLQIADVDYHNPHANEQSKYPEILEYENTIRKSVSRYVVNGKGEEMNDTFIPITALSGLHKHIGFQEEAEVRIIAIPPCKEVLDEIRKGNPNKKDKKREFLTRNGLLVPYINLFEDGGGGSKLPITRIIIGPSIDSVRRKKSVEMLLKERGIEADVTCSNIPYIGR